MAQPLGVTQFLAEIYEGIGTGYIIKEFRTYEGSRAGEEVRGPIDVDLQFRAMTEIDRDGNRPGNMYFDHAKLISYPSVNHVVAFGECGDSYVTYPVVSAMLAIPYQKASISKREMEILLDSQRRSKYALMIGLADGNIGFNDTFPPSSSLRKFCDRNMNGMIAQRASHNSQMISMYTGRHLVTEKMQYNSEFVERIAALTEELLQTHVKA